MTGEEQEHPQPGDIYVWSNYPGGYLWLVVDVNIFQVKTIEKPLSKSWKRATFSFSKTWFREMGTPRSPLVENHHFVRVKTG